MLRPFLRRNQNGVLKLIFGGKFASTQRPCINPITQDFSTIGSKPEKLHKKEPSCSILTKNLERDLTGHQIDEALETYKHYKRLYGFPDQFLLTDMITKLLYSSDSKYLNRAFNLVLSISKEKSVLLSPEVMTKLVLSLARAQIPDQASTILRLMLEKKSLPPLDVLKLVFLHLVKSKIGTYLASNILGEICEKLNLKKSELTKPDSTFFNLVLDACAKFESPLKGQQIIELMPQIGVKADAHTIVIISRIHEMNGMRDELKKFKNHIDFVPVSLIRHYQQFYDSLLNLHFKFNDVDAASELLLDMIENFESKPTIQTGQKGPLKPLTVSIGSDNVRMGLKLKLLPLKLQKDSIFKFDENPELIMYKNGKLALTNKGLAKFITGFKKNGRIDELSKFLIRVQNTSLNDNFISDVIIACVHMGWLEAAHDLLEDFESEKNSVSEKSYSSLLAAYYNRRMLREAEGLKRHIKKLRPDIYPLDQGVYLKDLASICKSDLTECILRNIKEEETTAAFPMVLVCNSSIYFFTKAKMMEDALDTYRKMQVKIQPTGPTFFYLTCGFSSLGMFREITILWGDIKRSMENRNEVYDRDLYEFLIMNFIRGGYFERVMEVVNFMMENGMFLDKWSYKIEFLKFHRDLYRRLSVVDAKNETQIQRIECVREFKKWAGVG